MDGSVPDQTRFYGCSENRKYILQAAEGNGTNFRLKLVTFDKVSAINFSTPQICVRNVFMENHLG